MKKVAQNFWLLPKILKLTKIRPKSSPKLLATTEKYKMTQIHPKSSPKLPATTEKYKMTQIRPIRSPCLQQPRFSSVNNAAEVMA
jgi:hypothetical protein